MPHVSESDALEQRRKFVDEAKDRADRMIAALSPDPETHRAVTLAARAGYALAKEEDGVGSVCPPEPQHLYCARLAANRFPLPPKRVLREEPDPHEFGTVWMARSDGGVERGIAHNGVVFKPTSSSAVPTVERVALWADLIARTYREVPDNGDER